MTGLDALREEMLLRGCNKAQVESKTAAIVLDILANSGTKYTDMAKQEGELSDLSREKQREIYRKEKSLESLNREIEDLERQIKKLQKEAQADNSYINDFLKKMEECETEEGRDTMRKAQVYINTIDINTKYDNTAFIIGLASILSNGNIGAIDELKKINPKMPTPSSIRIRWAEGYE